MRIAGPRGSIAPDQAAQAASCLVLHCPAAAPKSKHQRLDGPGTRHGSCTCFAAASQAPDCTRCLLLDVMPTAAQQLLQWFQSTGSPDRILQVAVLRQAAQAASRLEGCAIIDSAADCAPQQLRKGVHTTGSANGGTALLSAVGDAPQRACRGDMRLPQLRFLLALLPADLHCLHQHWDAPRAGNVCRCCRLVRQVVQR